MQTTMFAFKYFFALIKLIAGNTGLKCSITILSFLASEGPNYWLNNIENLWIVAKKSSNNVPLLFSIHVVEDYILLEPKIKLLIFSWKESQN